MKITMIGAGYVGLVSGACFSDFGHEVIVVDKDQSKLDRLAKGVMPIYEPGLAELVRRNEAASRLSYASDLGQAVDGRRRDLHRGRHAVPARRRLRRPHLRLRGGRDHRAGRSSTAAWWCASRRCRWAPAGRSGSASTRPAGHDLSRGRLQSGVPARGLGDRRLQAARPGDRRRRERARRARR